MEGGGVSVDNLAQQGLRLPVAWITRLQDETAEEYFRRAMCEAGQKGLALQKGRRLLPGRARRCRN